MVPVAPELLLNDTRYDRRFLSRCFLTKGFVIVEAVRRRSFNAGSYICIKMQAGILREMTIFGV
jgi:hypothetical protein